MGALAGDIGMRDSDLSVCSIIESLLTPITYYSIVDKLQYFNPQHGLSWLSCPGYSIRVIDDHGGQ